MKYLFSPLLLILCFFAFGQKIPFQGKLTENDEPVTGTRDFTFSFSNSEWTETYESVSILDGFYSVVLGSITPIPDSLFASSDEVQLTIEVDGTALSPVTIYLPYRQTVFEDHYDGTDDTPAISVKRTGVAGSGSAALEVVSEMEGASYALYGQATGTGDNYGVYGYANGPGNTNAGLFGVARGTGDGTTGYGTGSYNDGIIGWARDNEWGNAGVYGRAYGDKGVDNIGVVGWSEVNNGSDTVLNVGALGWAKGPGVNYGVRGIATDGIENWAGFFEGDVNVNGNLIVNGQAVGPSSNPVAVIDSVESRDIKILNPEGSLRAHLNYYGVNDAGSLVLYGQEDGRKAILGTSLGRAGGVYLYDSLNASGATLAANVKGGGRLYFPSSDGNTYNWISNNPNADGSRFGSVQVASTGTAGEYLSGTGMSGGFFYMDIKPADNFYTLVEMGLSPDGEGDDLSFFRLNSENRAIAGESSAISIAVAKDVGGSGGEVFLWGNSAPNFQIGGQQWQDSDQANFTMFGSKGDGLGWFRSNLTMSTFSSGDYDVTSLSMQNTEEGSSIETVYLTSGGAARSGQLVLRDSSSAEVINLHNNGTSGEISILSTDGAERVSMNANSMTGGLSPYTDGYELKMDQTNGAIFKMYAGGNNTISIEGNSGIINAVVNQTSDERLKENIQIQKGALEKVTSLRGVTFEWKADESNLPHIGFIAQEVEKVYPEMVNTKPDGYKSVNYSVLVSALVEAIKELNEKVSTLETENAGLKAELGLATSRQTDIEQLKKEIASIKQVLSLTVESSEASSVGQNK